jgi:hypothetical protein
VQNGGSLCQWLLLSSSLNPPSPLSPLRRKAITTTHQSPDGANESGSVVLEPWSRVGTEENRTRERQ